MSICKKCTDPQFSLPVCIPTFLLNLTSNPFHRIRYTQCYLIHRPGALVPAIRPPHIHIGRVSPHQAPPPTTVITLFSPVLSFLLRIVQQDSDNVEEAAQHFQSEVKHSHPQACNERKEKRWLEIKHRQWNSSKDECKSSTWSLKLTNTIRRHNTNSEHTENPCKEKQ